MAGYNFLTGDTQFGIGMSTFSIMDEQTQSFLDFEVSDNNPEGYFSTGSKVEIFPEDIVYAISNVTIEVFETGAISTSASDLQHLIDNVSIVGMWLKFLKNGQEQILAHILADGEIQGIIDGSRYLTREETAVVSSVVRRVAETFAKIATESTS